MLLDITFNSYYKIMGSRMFLLLFTENYMTSITLKTPYLLMFLPPSCNSPSDIPTQPSLSTFNPTSAGLGITVPSVMTSFYEGELYTGGHVGGLPML